MNVGDTVVCDDGVRATVASVQQFGLGALAATAVEVKRFDGATRTYRKADLASTITRAKPMLIVLRGGRAT